MEISININTNTNINMTIDLDINLNINVNVNIKRNIPPRPLSSAEFILKTVFSCFFLWFGATGSAVTFACHCCLENVEH